MAKKLEKIDTLFQKGLENHSTTPSLLAWERLESRLPMGKKESKSAVYWWAAAAAILILVAVSNLAWDPSSPETEKEVLAKKTDLVRQNDPVLPEANQQTLTTHHTVESNESEQNTNAQLASSDAEKIKQDPEDSTQPTTETIPNQLLSQSNPKAQPLDRKALVPISGLETKPTLEELPIYDPSHTVHKAMLTASVAEEPNYSLRIVSNGIQEEKSLLAGIGKRVNQVDGLLDKVDDGFASLQDAKNNLFASLSTKKEKGLEEE